MTINQAEKSASSLSEERLGDHLMASLASLDGAAVAFLTQIGLEPVPAAMTRLAADLDRALGVENHHDTGSSPR